MTKKLLSALIALLILVSLLSAIVGCAPKSEGDSNDTDSETSTGRETDSESETSEKETTGSSGGDTEGDEYGDGEVIENSGIAWDKDAFALLDYTVDESKATDISATELYEILRAESASENTVYRVNEPLILESGTDYDGNFASVIATQGIIIKDATDIVVRELIIKGDVTIENSSELVFFNVDIQGGDTAVTIDEASVGVAFKSCKISATELCMSIAGDTVTVFETKLTANKGIASTGNETAVHGCHFINASDAFTACGNGCIIRNSTLELNSQGIGIEFKEGSCNGLVALNRITGVQSSIVLSGGYNCAIIMNSATTVIGEKNTNVYVVENSLGGLLKLTNNDYVICEGNRFVSDDGKDHTIIDVNNTNVNGDNLTDINERAEVGANEKILPHTNKELFVGMERRTKVLDASFTKQYSLNQYIRNNSKNNDIVIVPPGAYSSSSAISLGSTHSGTKVYAYGVYEEFTQHDILLAVSGASNIEFYGLTMGYDFLSGGQLDILAKEGDTFTVVGSAGWGEDFGHSNPSKFSTGFTEIYTGDALYPWAVIGSYYTLKKNGDGTMSMTINDKGIASKTYVGDSMTCRYAGQNQSSVRVTDSRNVKFKDCVLYGFSNSLAVVASGTTVGMSLERFHNTTQPNPIIDKETYDKYAALEIKYGIDLGIFIDSAGRYRGALPLQGSTDATHIMSTSEGVDVTSSIFEGMTDDGSNQRASSSRLHKIEIDGNTATIYYKGLMAKQYEGTSTGSCVKFTIGDQIRVYTAQGALLCETTVTSNAELVESMSPITIAGTNVTTNVYRVTVSASSLDKDVLELINSSYDLSDNSSSLTNRVLVDNLSRNSKGFTFDNVIIRNTRSRGILVKTTDVTIKHCTFQNLAHTGIVICSEPSWGESTAATNTTITKCIFDNTGAVCDYVNDTEFVPIMIGEDSVSGVNVSAKSLIYKNITIDGCKFINNKSRYAITVYGAQNVSILNNTFCEIVDESALKIPTTIFVQKSMNVNISGNTFSANFITGSITRIIKVNMSKGIFGSDVTDTEGNPIFPDSVQ